MSISSTGLSSPGLGSGLDVNSLVSKLMAVEQVPLNVLSTREASYQSKLTTIGTLKSALSSLQTAAQALNTPVKFAPIKASVADASIFTAAPTTSAVAGSYSVEVQSLAQSQKLNFAGYADTTTALGTGTITLNFGTYTTDASPTPLVTGFAANAAKPSKAITIDTTNNTLAGIRDEINKSNAGVTASIINDGSANPYRLMLTSNDTGERNAIQISTTAGLNQFDFGAIGSSTANQTVAAKDAVIKVDNVTITKPSNVITDAVQGVTLNLAKAVPGTSTILTLTRDTSSVQNAIKSIVDAYNSVNKTIADATAYNTTSGKAGALNGDSTTRAVQTQLRNLFSRPTASATPGMSVLSDVGISFQKDGSLSIDSAKLSAVLADPTKDVSKLFAGSASAKGYAAQADSLIGSILSPVGIIAGQTKGINSSITDIGRQRTALNLKLVNVEKNYRNQFNAMDKAVASMQSTSAYLTQQLSALSASTG